MAKFLIPDKTITLAIGDRTLTVHQKIIPDDMVAPRNVADWVRKGQPMKPREQVGPNGRPLGVCIHNTNDIRVASGTNAAEQYSRATFNGNMAGVVVHYYVWRDEIWQLLRLDERGWHAADGRTRRDGRRPGQRIGGNLDFRNGGSWQVRLLDTENCNTARIAGTVYLDGGAAAPEFFDSAKRPKGTWVIASYEGSASGKMSAPQGCSVQVDEIAKKILFVSAEAGTLLLVR